MEPQITNVIEQIQSIRHELAELAAKRDKLEKELLRLEKNHKVSTSETDNALNTVTNDSHHDQKIELFMSLFKGRADVFSKRFESQKTGKSGYQPACDNEWVSGTCKKPNVKCANCEHREFTPLSNTVIRDHLLGYALGDKTKRNFTVGLYPLLQNETCHFLAIDFDGSNWQTDISAYLRTCVEESIPAAMERSRSGNGGHIWIFFAKPVSAKIARIMASFILTETMERYPEIGFDSYDRFFPNQDTMPKGGFGNLIALPLQGHPRQRDNSVFIDDDFFPFPDQWAFLSTIEKMSLLEVEAIVQAATQKGNVLGVRFVSLDEDEEPWTAPPSRQRKLDSIQGELPSNIRLVLGNQIYIEKSDLPPALINRLIRIAAFQNPEFYKAQAMRLSTWNKPRIISCHEDFPKHIGLPRGCLEGITKLLDSHSIIPEIVDEREQGVKLSLKFQGKLYTEQKKAIKSLIQHDTGILSAATAFGKTVVGIALLARRNVNTLILVHRKPLMDQWIAALQKFLDIDDTSIGHIGGGKWKPTGIIDVAMIQSLSRKGEVKDIVGKYGHLIVDECHHISARSFEIVARQCKAKYTLGLTATTVRKDGHHPIIFMNIGAIRFKVGHRKQAAKRPFSHKVIFRNTNLLLPSELSGKDDLPIHKIYSLLVKNDQRNKMIADDIIQATQAGRTPLVLTERRDHLEDLNLLLSARINNIVILHGGMGKKHKQSLMDKINTDGDRQVILATGRYIGEGFDLAKLDTLFLTMPVSWKGVLTQYAGRLHRLHTDKKEVVIYDYFDANIPMLAKMHKRRLSGYRSIGYNFD
ncbi:MAG: DEAD/DEAH box helicase family protein [Bacteroidota bacterium]|nr:DEAD/DEAH box helicase family protein [Bacteroidota bacterium]